MRPKLCPAAENCGSSFRAAEKWRKSAFRIPVKEFRWRISREFFSCFLPLGREAAESDWQPPSVSYSYIMVPSTSNRRLGAAQLFVLNCRSQHDVQCDQFHEAIQIPAEMQSGYGKHHANAGNCGDCGGVAAMRWMRRKAAASVSVGNGDECQATR